MFANTMMLSVAVFAAQAPASPAGDSNAQTDHQGEIVVTAPADTPTKLERQRELREMVTELVRKPRTGRTVGTFFEAICPKVVGLPDNAARVIKARIAENAARLGANRRNPAKNCNHNVLVEFIPANKGAPADWLTYDSDSLSHLLGYQRLRVLDAKDPVRAWNTTQLRSADGVPIPETAQGKFAQVSNRLRSASRLRSPTTTEIRSAVVLIELASANGKTLQQLADYATMRALASTGEIDRDAEPAAPTILTLFQEDTAPDGLTIFDQAFITGLYQKSRNTLPKKYYSGIAATAANMELADQSASSAR